MSSKKFLGKGIKFPVRLSSDGHINISSYEEDIRESIFIILGTAKGERVMRPDFGCDINKFVFETTDATTIEQMKSAVREALVRWEPRISVDSISITKDSIDLGKLIISVRYTVRSTNNQFNLVYPFYITEGGE